MPIGYKEQPAKANNAGWDGDNKKYTYLGDIIQDRLFAVLSPALTDTVGKAEARMYDNDLYNLSFCQGRFYQDWFVCQLQYSEYLEFFHFHDKDSKKVEEAVERWVSDGFCVALKVRGTQLEYLRDKLVNTGYVLTGSLKIFSEPVDYKEHVPLCNLFDQYLESKKPLSPRHQKMLDSVGLNINIHFEEDLGDIEDLFSESFEFETGIDVISKYLHLPEFVFSFEATEKKGSYRRSGYSPEQRLEFVKSQLVACGFDTTNLLTISTHALKSTANYLAFKTALGMAQCYQPSISDYDVLADDNLVVIPLESKTSKEETTLTEEKEEQETSNDEHPCIALLKEKATEFSNIMPDNIDLSELTDVDWLDSLQALLETGLKFDLVTFKRKMIGIAPDAEYLIDLSFEELNKLIAEA